MAECIEITKVFCASDGIHLPLVALIDRLRRIQLDLLTFKDLADESRVVVRMTMRENDLGDALPVNAAVAQELCRLHGRIDEHAVAVHPHDETGRAT